MAKQVKKYLIDITIDDLDRIKINYDLFNPLKLYNIGGIVYVRR